MIQKFKENFPDTIVYEESVTEDDGKVYSIIQDQTDRYLMVLSKMENLESINFAGENLEMNGLAGLKCPLNHQNASILRVRFPFTKPVLIGKQSSYGLGDRLGNAGVAHLKSIRKTSFRPVLAQQSIRELQRTNRTAEEVLDAASWAVFQAGFGDGFGADGDHLKTKQDIDLMVKAGYTMFTIDPSDDVVNEVDSINKNRLKQEFLALPWSLLDINPEGLLKRYADKEIKLSHGSIDELSEEKIMSSMVKYGKVISHTKVLSDYLSNEYANHPAELELSVDETDEPTTLFEHYLIASELIRLDVELVSLAPRFCGDFEKGIDFKGDIEQFKREYSQHLAIAETFGGYKLSVHSGSDKFSSLLSIKFYLLCRDGHCGLRKQSKHSI